MRNLVVFGALLASTVGCSTAAPVYTDVLDMHGASVEQMQIVISEAFDLSEVAVLKTTPDDTPKPLGPDPDPKKCICGGTGVITHGDGHTSPCPYHGKGQETETPNLIVEGDVLYERNED